MELSDCLSEHEELEIVEKIKKFVVENDTDDQQEIIRGVHLNWNQYKKLSTGIYGTPFKRSTMFDLIVDYCSAFRPVKPYTPRPRRSKLVLTKRTVVPKKSKLKVETEPSVETSS